MKRGAMLPWLLIGGVSIGLSAIADEYMSRHFPRPVSNAVVVDGDTFKVNGKRWRLARINAPEMPGHCRPGRNCPPGDPVASKNALAAWLEEPVTCKRVGTDFYKRPLVECWASGINISDAMLRQGMARPYEWRKK